VKFLCLWRFYPLIQQEHPLIELAIPYPKAQSLQGQTIVATAADFETADTCPFKHSAPVIVNSPRHLLRQEGKDYNHATTLTQGLLRTANTSYVRLS